MGGLGCGPVGCGRCPQHRGRMEADGFRFTCEEQELAFKQLEQAIPYDRATEFHKSLGEGVVHTSHLCWSMVHMGLLPYPDPPDSPPVGNQTANEIELSGFGGNRAEFVLMQELLRKEGIDKAKENKLSESDFIKLVEFMEDEKTDEQRSDQVDAFFDSFGPNYEVSKECPQSGDTIDYHKLKDRLC